MLWVCGDVLLVFAWVAAGFYYFDEVALALWAREAMLVAVPLVLAAVAVYYLALARRVVAVHDDVLCFLGVCCRGGAIAPDVVL